ncbi:hypothetical protein [Actinomadura macrotermitis]|uniref:Uncharacterized protein n=1 Tax=Actinomadura macrotermitis TaxID=2585200 RepID=A0A7K0BU51_9ACTN|nr:hypothetical protein [Actinomadura macrotermitis]MQY04422.1 hypothetical protein [Actinomadura macrotermitis]
MRIPTAFRLPFTARPWRESLYALLAGPAALVAVADGGRLQRRLAARLLHRDVPATRLRGLLGLPLYPPFLLVAGYGWLIAVLNLGYPLRPLLGMPGYDPHAWGGPTYAGAWAFHALAGGLPALLATPWIVRALTAVQARILGR